MVDEGFMSAARRDELEGSLPHFIQTNSRLELGADFDIWDDLANENKLVNLNQQALAQQVMGTIGDKKDVRMIPGSVINTHIRTRLSLAEVMKRNEIKRTLFDLHDLGRQSGVNTGIVAARKVEGKYYKILDSAGKIDEKVSAPLNPDDFRTAHDLSANSLEKTFFRTVDGVQEKITLFVPKELESVFHLPESQANQHLRLAGTLMGVPLFRWGTTVANTAFIPTNMLIDAMTFLQRSGTWMNKNPLASGGELFKAYRDMVLGNQAAIWGGSMIFGGGVGAMTGDSLTERARNAAITAAVLGLGIGTIGKGLKIPKIPKDLEDYVGMGAGQTNLYHGTQSVEDVRRGLGFNAMGSKPKDALKNLRDHGLADGVLEPITSSSKLMRIITDTLTLKPIREFGEAVEFVPRLAAGRLAKKRGYQKRNK